jgi:hypothetical protein
VAAGGPVGRHWLHGLRAGPGGPSLLMSWPRPPLALLPRPRPLDRGASMEVLMWAGSTLTLILSNFVENQ